MEDILTQWHPAFCSAMKLELSFNEKDLDFTEEYLLNSSPIKVDLLIIRKHPDVEIENEVGKLFKGHNVVEYKSPQDSLNIDTLYKVVGYACLYKAGGGMVDSIKADDLTVSLVWDGKPDKLFKQMEELGMTVGKAYDGIYYVKGCIFDIQIIVGKELNEENHIWLTALTEHLSQVNAERLVYQFSSLKEKGKKELAESVLQVSMSKNKSIFNHVKEDEPMACEALKELMKPEIDAMKAEMEAKMKAEMEAKMKAEMQAEKDAMQAEKDAMQAEKDAEIAKLKAEIAKLKENK